MGPHAPVVYGVLTPYDGSCIQHSAPIFSRRRPLAWLKAIHMNRLFFGDNLDWLRNTTEFPDACVDLIYLDPPFNSKRDYNLLFKSPKGHESEAQITAFEDSWHWGVQAEQEFDELLH